MVQRHTKHFFSAFLFASMLFGALSSWAQNLTEEPQTGGFAVQSEMLEESIDKDSQRPLQNVNCSSVTDLPCLTRDQIRELQINLSSLGFDPGPVDGAFGPRTLQALDNFRATAGLDGYGYPQISEVRRVNRFAENKSIDLKSSYEQRERTENRQADVGASVGGLIISNAGNAATRPSSARKAAAQASSSPTGRPAAPTPTRTFAGPGQFPPTGFRGYGFVAFPARAAEFDFKRHTMICQAYMNSLPTISAVRQSREDQFVTVWPLTDGDEAVALNRKVRRSVVPAACERAINGYDANRAREVIRMVRQNEDAAFEGRGPFLFGWIPADGFGEVGKLILLLDLSRVTTYEQALTQLQSWQQRVETNPELLRDGFSIENLRRLIRDWSDQHGQAFLLLIGSG
ncbi:MAG: peptidoglycan-binding domain-containing protein [Roseovarius sp.]